MRDETLKQVVLDQLAHEGQIPWLYCDVKGLVTVGIGHLVPSADAASRLAMFANADCVRMASPQELREAWVAVKQSFAPGKGVMAYKGVSAPRMGEHDARALCQRRLRNEFVPAVEAAFPAIASWPDTAVRAVLDIAYNCGAHCFDRGWPALVAACRRMDWPTAAKECVRADARRKPTPQDPEGLGHRNRWTIAMLHAAAVGATGPLS